MFKRRPFRHRLEATPPCLDRGPRDAIGAVEHHDPGNVARQRGQPRVAARQRTPRVAHVQNHVDGAQHLGESPLGRRHVSGIPLDAARERSPSSSPLSGRLVELRVVGGKQPRSAGFRQGHAARRLERAPRQQRRRQDGGSQRCRASKSRRPRPVPLDRPTGRQAVRRLDGLIFLFRESRTRARRRWGESAGRDLRERARSVHAKAGSRGGAAVRRASERFDGSRASDRSLRPGSRAREARHRHCQHARSVRCARRRRDRAACSSFATPRRALRPSVAGARSEWGGERGVGERGARARATRARRWPRSATCLRGRSRDAPSAAGREDSSCRELTERPFVSSFLLRGGSDSPLPPRGPATARSASLHPPRASARHKRRSLLDQAPVDRAFDAMVRTF